MEEYETLSCVCGYHEYIRKFFFRNRNSGAAARKEERAIET